jgi:SPP1 family predicted phage head-tail adaptor
LQDISQAGDELPVFATWQENVPCDVKHVRGGETFRGRQVTAEIALIVDTRYQSEINETMRIDHGGKIYEIAAVLDRKGRDWFLELHCFEVH